LVLSDLCAVDGATFEVVVRNIAGSVTSSPPAILTVVPLTAADPITDGLVAHWTFDETAGATAQDGTANANHGQLRNFPTDDSQWVPGQIGGALNFRGPAAGDYVVVPDYPKPGSTLTISAWVWAESLPTWATILKNWQTEPTAQFHFGLNDAQGDLSNYLIQQGGTFVGPVREGANAPLPLASWQHVALVCDGSAMRLYRNGVPVGAPLPYNGTINTTAVASSLGIGAKLGPGDVPPTSADSGYWHGKMDDLGFWHRGLSPSEIQGVYNAGLQGRDLTTASVLPSLVIQRAGTELIISWPAAPAGVCYVLESAADVPNSPWTPVGIEPTLSNGRYWVSLALAGGNQFFRLRK
jgi:hypothetical protein